MGVGGGVATAFDAALGDLDAVVGRLVGLAGGDGLSGYEDGRLVEVMQRFEGSRNRLAGVDHGFVAAAVERELPARLVSGSPAKLLTTVLRLSPVEASRRVRAAEAVSPRMSPTGQPLPPVRPLLAAAQAAGEAGPEQVGPEQVAVVESALRSVDRPRFDPAAVEGGERLLVGFAATFGPPDLRRLARQVVDAIDPDGSLPDDELAADRRHLHLRATKDGSVVGEFRLTPACGAKLQAVLTPLVRPRPDLVLDEGLPAVPDSRAYIQRMHDGLEEMCDRLLRSGTLPDSGGTPATVVVTMSVDDLITRTGHATTAGGAPISVAEALRLAVEAEIVPVVLSGRGDVLQLGRTRPIASPSQTLALAARDGGCSFPGCDRTPDLCERHHIVARADGGPTDLDNVTLLCRYHHHNFAERGWTCKLNEDRVPQWRPPRWVDPRRRPQTHHRTSPPGLLRRARRPVLPALLDPPEPPDRQGHHPDEHEGPDGGPRSATAARERWPWSKPATAVLGRSSHACLRRPRQTGPMSSHPVEAPGRLQQAVALLRQRHERVTPVRLAVLSVLERTREHLSAEEVVTLAAQQVPTVHRATVYRALATLGDLGLVAHIHLGGTATVYHLTVSVPPAAADHHVHLQCTRCGTVLDAPADTMTALQARLEQEQGFRLDPGHTALLGTCADCRAAG